MIEEDAVFVSRTAMPACCVLFAILAPWAAAKEHCCREVPWGTVTVAVHDGRLITTGGGPQHPSAFALDKVLGDDESEVVLNAAVQLRTPAPTFATKNAKVMLEVGAGGGVKVKVRDQVTVSRAEVQTYRPVQLQAEVELSGTTPIQIKATRPGKRLSVMSDEAD